MFGFTFIYPKVESIEKLEAKAKEPNAPCSTQMIAWAECIKEAQASYADEGNDISNQPAWTAYNLRKCLHPFVDARECLVDKKVSAIKKMKEKMTEDQWEEFQKKIRLSAHKTTGLDKFEEAWRPDLDYSGYFKAYRSFMEEQFKLEDELRAEMATGSGIPQEPYKYFPQKFVYKG